jgi:hypothetical protein
MSSPKENLTAYIAELQPFFNPPILNNGIITLNLKQEITDSYEAYRTYKSFLGSSKLKLFVDKFPGGGCIIKSTLDIIFIDVDAFLKGQSKKVSSEASTLQPKHKSGDKSKDKDIDFHVARLKGYFQVSKADISASIKSLLSIGWTEKQFKAVGVSSATYHRHKTDRAKSKGKTSRFRKKTPKQ